MSKTGLKRESFDKFYTKDSVVKQCIKVLKKLEIINKDDIIIEPSAGSGNFIPYLEEMVSNLYSYDIDPCKKSIYYEKIIKDDYLIIDETKYISMDKKIHIVGNPPFGRQSSLAKKFIKKSSKYADTIGFILPKSFKKESLRNIFPLNFHLEVEIELEENAFIVDEMEYNVPCVFQVWIKKNFLREKVVSKEPIYFNFVKKNESPTLSIRRVGVNAGKIDKNTEKNEQSHYFLKLNDYIDVDVFIEEYSKIEFEFNNTVGPKSISKPELIEKINLINFD